ncbi:FAD dependent oxidoreductase [Gloeomargarita lithophora Alchichica-D10]|uniref:FAD dependent oxidoreductase n=1 Tax=Gloeomargarita lithophora Alchichica-D10 TaxID=1188229 RepID=A0A1J0AE13_9CYAN|nr:FAD-dependent oxidoreductase [Gloeomargarita lithophora]APB34139.1 FAD dependent oxidoreductase [Gloeomargarita lithophora Alchichica-D10]
MSRIAIIGAGVIGAAIAWELSTLPGQEIHVFEAQSSPAQGATGAALGLLMAVLSERGAKKRLASLQRYHQIQTKLNLPGDQKGILHLYHDPQAWAQVQRKIPQRQKAGWSLQTLSPEQVTRQFPQINTTRINTSHLIGAILSPQEIQFQPIALTENWLNLAQNQGVSIHTNSPVVSVVPGQPIQLKLPDRAYCCDWLIVSAGLGSTQIPGLTAPFQLEPVLGQAIEILCPELENYPILYGNDTAIVPQKSGIVWVGSTVEFSQSEPPIPNAEQLDQLWQKACHLCPILQSKSWQKQWYGLRPRPVGQPAPILQIDPQFQGIIWATGHYRNGVLLAPFTADWVRQAIENQPV